MAKSKQNKPQLKWLIVMTITIVLGLFLFFNKNNFLVKQGLVNLTKEEAIAKVKTQREVENFFKQVPQAKVEAENEENSSYTIHVYEIKNGHTATLNWYTVNKATGEVKKEF